MSGHRLNAATRFSDHGKATEKPGLLVVLMGDEATILLLEICFGLAARGLGVERIFYSFFFCDSCIVQAGCPAQIGHASNAIVLAQEHQDFATPGDLP